MASAKGSVETSQVSRPFGDVECPGSLPCGTLSILVFMVVTGGVVVVVEVVVVFVLVSVASGEGETEAEADDESDRRNGRAARLLQTRFNEAKGVDLGTTIKFS